MCAAWRVSLDSGVSACLLVVILDLIQDLFRLREFGWNGMPVPHGGHGVEMLKQVQHDARWWVLVVVCRCEGCGVRQFGILGCAGV